MNKVFYAFLVILVGILLYSGYGIGSLSIYGIGISIISVALLTIEFKIRDRY
ncbi:hypothetical protein [Virgibacillus halodenitrificans]|uniref:hypothetical protein n=1 Tax=Virgibacillus halodenitrificans TaxID=1482 RepID=UPI000B089F56|nr:hypothetical protein [Virgibacillus halodenitrificans]